MQHVFIQHLFSIYQFPAILAKKTKESKLRGRVEALSFLGRFKFFFSMTFILIFEKEVGVWWLFFRQRMAGTDATSAPRGY